MLAKKSKQRWRSADYLELQVDESDKSYQAVIHLIKSQNSGECFLNDLGIFQTSNNGYSAMLLTQIQYGLPTQLDVI